MKKRFNNKYIYLSVVLLLSVFLLSVFIVTKDRSTNIYYDTLKREELSYLSSMMKVLASAIENNDSEYALLASSMIEESGAITCLSGENRENATEFINVIFKNDYNKSKAAAYARKCSAAAINTLKGIDYIIGSYEDSKIDKTKSFNSFECKNQVRHSRKVKEGFVAFYSSVNAENICCRRGNVYYLTKIGETEPYESVFCTNLKKFTAEKSLSRETAIEYAKEIMNNKKIENYLYLFEDEGTIFITCMGKTENYLIGIDEQSGRCSYFKNVS